MKKTFLPESFDFGMPSVELIGVGSKGLDKTAMVKRASAFEDVLPNIEKKANREYLHVITTGAFEKYGANANCFEGHTPVLVSLTGERKRIKDIKAGDMVLTGNGRLRPVLRVMSRKYKGEIVEVQCENWRQRITMTADHPVQVVDPRGRETVDGSFVKAGTLDVYDKLIVPALQHRRSNKQVLHDSIMQIKSRTCKSVTVYNLEVEEDHTYCVPFIVHNCDAWNGEAYEIDFPHPENPQVKKAMLDGGLSKYHDDTYMKNGDVYQEHKTKRSGVDPSGEVVAARYNPIMKRGELIISVDVKKWAPRLQKKAQGKDIFLSIGADVPRDLCFVGSTLVLTDKGYTQIKDIQKGDLVYTQQGNLKKVLATSVHEADILVDIHTTCIPGQMTCTQNHPIYAAQCEHPINSVQELATLRYDFIPAGNLTLNSILKVKLDSCAEPEQDEGLFQEKCKSASQFGKEGRSAEELALLLGRSAEEKRCFLVSYIDRNTKLNRKAYRHGGMLGFTSRESAMLIQRLFWSIDIPAVIYDVCDGGAKMLYVICMAYETEALTDLVRRTRKQNGIYYAVDRELWLHDGFAYIPLVGVSSYRVTDNVYNLEVEDDHTYNAEGIDVHNCIICGRSAKTASQHCEHFTKHRGQVYDCGKRACVMNDSPHFYDISGVDVPADQIAFVLSKVASGATAKEAALEVMSVCSPRRPMLYTKAAAILDKLSNMEKQILGMVEGDKQEPAFHDDDEAAKDFILKVENFPSDEIIDSCNRKGILLSPGMLFKIMGKDCTDENDKEMLCSLEDGCCGDCSTMFEDMEEDECCNAELLDGSFDEHLPADLSLDDILEKFVPEFGVTQPAMQGKIITVTITGRKKKEPEGESKEASLNKQAQEALRRTYARYVISFAERNDDATCRNALRKIAVYGK